jgi:hypothetical protein
MTAERTDREMLELAAKAVGIPVIWMQTTGRWNPLEDDGDAFRLMVALGIRPEFDGYAELAMQDELYKTRRAIVRAAAAMAEGGEQ